MNLRLVIAVTLAAVVPQALLAGDRGAARGFGGTITDGAATFTRVTYGTGPLANFTGVSATLATDHLYELGWWIRVSDGGQEVPFPLPTAQDTYVGDTATATWTPLGGTGGLSWLNARETTTVIDTSGQTGGPSSYLLVQLHLENVTDGTFPIRLYHYADLDVDGTNTGDSAAFVEKTPNEVLQMAEGVNFAQHIGAVTGYVAPDEIHHQVTSFPTLKGLLNDSAITELDGSGVPFGPGDATGAFQFDLLFEPFGEADVAVVVAINVALHCSSPNGVFCDGFETGDRDLWSSPP